MDRASYFIKDKALFGSFPTQESIKELENNGVRFFIDLTYKNERGIIPYKTIYKYISYPIYDQQIPSNNLEFAIFIVKICDIIKKLKDNEKIYIHCKGGHGRSGLVVAIILSKIFDISGKLALEYTKKAHNMRKIMKDKWRQIGSPQTFLQKSFVINFTKTIYFGKSFKNSISTGFSNFSEHSIYIEPIGLFPNAESAIQAHKNLKDIKYVNKHLKSPYPMYSKNLGKKYPDTIEWIKKCPSIVLMILRKKYEQNEYLKQILLNTKLCKLVSYIKGDYIFSIGDNGEGLNILGKQLMKLRDEYLRQLNN